MERTNVSKLRSRKIETKRYFDFSLLFLVIFTCIVGLILIYSSSSYWAQKKNLPPNYFFSQQRKTFMIGLAAMCTVMLIPYRLFFVKIPFIRGRFVKVPFLKIRMKEKPHVVGCMVPIRPFAVLVILAFGLQFWASFLIKETTNGATRWINLGFATLQVSELSKFSLILWASYICYRNTKTLKKYWSIFWLTLPFIPLIVMIAKENLSSAIIAVGIYFLIFFVAGKGIWNFVIYTMTGMVLAAIYVVYKDGYQLGRVMAWRNLEGSKVGEQVLQGLYSIASGGILGKGLGESAGKYGRISESYNDMIFTIICEELGILGALAILILYIFILYRMLKVAYNAPDLLGSLITVGVMAEIAIQVILNVAVVTNTIPSTGITLPFISFGGSSIIFLLMGVGMVLNISFQIKYRA